MTEFIRNTFLCFGIPTAIALLLSGKWRQLKPVLWSLAALAAVLANAIIITRASNTIPSTAFMQGLQWNWIGKMTATIASLVLFLALPKELQREAGILKLPKSDNWRRVFTGSALLLTFFWKRILHFQRWFRRHG